MKDYANAELGLLGGRAITGTSAITANAAGYFYKIHFITSSVVTNQAGVSGTTNPMLAALTAGITAGTIVYGQYTSITLSSGQAIGYFGD